MVTVELLDESPYAAACASLTPCALFLLAHWLSCPL